MAKKATKKTTPQVPDYRKCPLCFHGMEGTGKAYSTSGPTTYYKCTRCGHCWTVRFKPKQTIIQHREVDVQTRGDNTDSAN